VSLPRLYCDEDVGSSIVDWLRKYGFDIQTARDAGRDNQKLRDEDQLTFATENDRILVTHNGRDFFEISRRWAAQGRPYSGVIVVAQRHSWEIQEALQRFFDERSDGLAFHENCFHRIPG
jgi:predicted nuclease of predicted toxin-antitoxin system